MAQEHVVYDFNSFKFVEVYLGICSMALENNVRSAVVGQIVL